MGKQILLIKSTGELCIPSGIDFMANQIGNSSTQRGNIYQVVELLDPERDFFPSGITRQVTQDDLEMVRPN
ncbi:hypothetical protein WJM97_00710 [Okeanomitos corallinicola TIOX110]|uniref:Uncharacterized protein n=1 Tax=Okeanomitos corallinicola TIOX110 TaxID=3133117 RepID=A0ABZ2USH8_9CYAN